MLLRLRAQIEKVAGKKVVLLLEDGQRLTVDRDELFPSGVPDKTEEQPYVIEILPEEEARLEREALARTLLNQLLDDPHAQDHPSQKGRGDE